MGDAFGYLLIAIGIYVVGWIITRLINKSRKQELLNKMPSKENLLGYIQQIHALRTQGASYEDQLQHLTNQGVDSKIAEVIIANVEKNMTD